MTVKETQALIRQNLAMYRVGEKTFTEEQAATQLAIWAAALQDVPARAGMQAMQRAFTVCRFPVTLADLFDQLRAMQATQSRPAADVWRELLQAARKAHDNAAEYRYTFRGPDGKTQGQHARERNQALYAALHPAAREWLGSVDELAALEELDERSLHYRRKDFEQLYAAFVQRQALDPELLQLALSNASRPQIAGG